MTTFKLYYTPTSCGAANFIVASLSGVEFDSEQVDIGSAKKTASGADFLAINPKGNVPAVVMPSGYVMSENVATLSYLADRNPKAGLIPSAGPERYEFLDKLGFVNTTLHKAFGPLFNPKLDDTAKVTARANCVKQCNYFMDSIVKDQEYACGGSTPTAVDIYAYIVFTWSAYFGVNLPPKAAAFMAKVKALPGVAAAHEKMNAASK